MPARRSEPVCDLFGVRRHIARFRQGEHYTFSSFDVGEPEAVGAPPTADVHHVRATLLVRILETVERYNASGRFTDKELLVIRRYWLERWSLDRIARAEGVSRQAIRERIVGNRRGQGGVLKKASEFAAWWTFINRRRRRKASHVA